MQQLINAAIATFDSLLIKSIPGPGLKLGPLTQKADTLTLCYACTPDHTLVPVVVPIRTIIVLVSIGNCHTLVYMAIPYAHYYNIVLGAFPA